MSWLPADNCLLPLRRLRRLALREPRSYVTVEIGGVAQHIVTGRCDVPAPRFGNRISLYDIRLLRGSIGLLALIRISRMHDARRAADLVAQLVAKHRGQPIRPDETRLLQVRTITALPGQIAELSALHEEAFRGFFRAAGEGESFVDPADIQARFGRTLGENYPDAGPAFLRFAASYWSLKMFLDRLSPDVPADNAALNILREIERPAQLMFFPVYGPVKVDPTKREADQRAILEAMAPHIDIEDFLARNPILLRDRAEQSKGCAVLVAVGIGLAWAVAVL